MQTQVEELAGNRVRLTVEVPREDVKHAVEHAASDLRGAVKVPGFRKGKVPLQVLVARVGKERLYREAVESHISSWFWNAAASTRLRPIEQPEYGYDLPGSAEESFAFTATFAVQPPPDLVDWTGLEVSAPDAEVPEALVDHELDVLRSTVADLVPAERPAQEGDTLVLDLVNETGETQRDYVSELGANRLLPEIEQALLGMSAGETTEVEFQRSDIDTARVTVAVKEIKEKVMPPLDDELARAASEFDTLDGLRGDIEGRLREQLEEEAETAFRAAVVDKLVEASNVEAKGPLVEARTRELLAALQRSVERRGISLETYLQLIGGDANEFIDRLRAEAQQSVARELVLEAAAARFGIDVSDDEIEELIREQAETAGEDPEQAIEQIFAAGAHERLREDLRLRKSLDRLASEVKRVSPEREQIWTPDKEKPTTETKLWTPGSKERA